MTDATTPPPTSLAPSGETMSGSGPGAGPTTGEAPGGSRAADLGLLLVAITWGGSYLAAKVLVDDMSPACVLALRFLPSLLVLLGVAAVRRSRFTRRGTVVGLILGVLQSVTLLLETTAVTRTSATNAGVLVCIAVLIAPVLEGALARTRLPGLYYLAAGTSIAGVAMLLGPSGLTRPNTGDLLVLAAAGTRACLMVSSARLTRGHHFDAVAINTVQTALATVVFTVLAGSALPGAVSHLNVNGWLVVAFLSVGCTCAAFLTQLWAIHHTSATRASLLMGTEPVWALIVGVVLAGEHLSPLGGVGAVVIIAATVWGQRVEARWRRAAS